MKLFNLYTGFFVLSISAFSQSDIKLNDKKLLINNVVQDSISEYSIKPVTVVNLEYPYTAYPKDIISHTGYSFLFSIKDKQAVWIAYQLTSEETVKLFNRSDKFTPDKSVKTGTANDNDYKGSGYDRGHLAPAADMGWSAKAMEESFYYSNMSPQKPSFNRGIWKQLEELVRDWAVENDAIYIVTGGVLNDNLSSIGKDKISVPRYFYKVILDYKEPSIKGIGFIMPNESSKEPLQRYAVTIDSVERFTGINFFYQLPDDQEKAIESTLSIKSWNWSSSISSNMGASQIIKSENSAKRCIGITKKGIQCKNETTNSNRYCYLHQDQFLLPQSKTVNDKEKFK